MTLVYTGGDGVDIKFTRSISEKGIGARHTLIVACLAASSGARRASPGHAHRVAHVWRVVHGGPACTRGLAAARSVLARGAGRRRVPREREGGEGGGLPRAAQGPRHPHQGAPGFPRLPGDDASRAQPSPRCRPKPHPDAACRALARSPSQPACALHEVHPTTAQGYVAELAAKSPMELTALFEQARRHRAHPSPHHQIGRASCRERV